MIRRASAAVLVLAACARPAPVASCEDDLQGAWRSDRDERWMLLDHRRTLEAYPLFPDAPADRNVAPRAIDLSRGGGRLVGEVRRRYERGADVCIATAAVHVTRCTDDTLELVLADPPPPLAFAPCAQGRPTGAHRERWRRE